VRKTRRAGKGNGESVSVIQAELIGMAMEGVKYDDNQKRYELALKRKGYKLMHSFGHG